MPYCVDCGHEVSPGARKCPSCGRVREPTESRKKGRPWLLIGLGCAVFLLVFGGMIAAILIPNFLDALQKAKQKRTMADLQEISEALESYRELHDGRVPDAGSIDELAVAIGDDLPGGLTTEDAWGGALVYACWTEELPADPGAGRCDTYRLISAGRDGEMERDDPAAYDVAPFPPLDYDRDLVVGDGYFYRYPGEADEPAEPAEPIETDGG